MSIKTVLIRFLSIIKTRKLLKRCEHSKNCRIKGGRTASIILLYGSKSEDIYIGDNCLINGSIVSEYNGKVIFGKFSAIGANSIIRAVDKVIIGPYTAISTGVVISDNNNHPVHPEDRMVLRVTPPQSYERSWIHSDHAPIIIGKNCWIGENSRICKGVTIGEGAVVAANTVVTKDVPANSIVAGNPMRIVKVDIDKTVPRKFNV